MRSLSKRVYEKFRANATGWKGDPPIQKVMADIDELQAPILNSSATIHGTV
jgi:hypothetical protein